MRRLVFAWVLLAAGCPDTTPAAGPVTTCVEAYVKCKLPDGPLGVCEPIPSCTTGPCFKCQGQH